MIAALSPVRAVALAGSPLVPSAGCVSLSGRNLTDVLSRLRPGVRFAIGRRDFLTDRA